LAIRFERTAVSPRLASLSVAAAAACGAAVLDAQESRPWLEEVEAVGTTPLGADEGIARIPANVQAATSEQIRERGGLDLADFLKRSLGSVFVNEAQSNPLQPDVQYRGFVGSPLLGLPQGIAVYQDAVRVNEPFGDTVNWVLIPESAIDTLYVMPGSNPLFGLNALGGAIAIETKDGFKHPGSRAEIYGGSFSRVGVQVETGGSIDDRLGFFVTGARLEEDGWRHYSPTEATQLFGSLGWRAERTAVDLNLTYADTDLIGNGAAPVQLLDADRSAIFTRPDQTENELTLVGVTARHSISRRLELSGNVYARSSDIATFNGDDSDFEECDDLPGFMCEEEGDEEAAIFDENGLSIPAAETLEGATINRTITKQDGVGLAFQATLSGDLYGRANRLVAGVSYDESDIGFDASTELGMLDPTRRALPGGVFVGDAFTSMNADTSHVGFFLSDALSVTRRLTLTLSGRYNRADVTLRDRLGTALNGDHRFERFNPAVGMTFEASNVIAFYAGYSESNRAPSPVELTCADEDDPCRLPNAFVADPPLEQVVAKTLEAGFRGRATAFGVDWHAGIFSTINEDDILFISAGALTNQGFFDNVGRTRRRGVELNLDGVVGDRFDWFAHYTFLDATFRDATTVPSHHNPLAVDGEIFVERGDELPLIPRQLLKAGARFAATSELTFGADVFASGGQYLRGDEGNLLDRIDGYAVLNLRAEYAVNATMRIFASIDNVLDGEYETFGVFGEADEVLGDDFDDARFLSPGAPRAAWVGLRLSF
jgi:iron complex outermembrane recepter protein